MLFTVTKENFAAKVEQAEGPVLVEFSATWCSHCQQLRPLLDELDKKFDGRLPLALIDTDHDPELAQRLQVEFIPSLVVYKNGNHGALLTAPASLEAMEEWLQEQGVTE